MFWKSAIYFVIAIVVVLFLLGADSPRTIGQDPMLAHTFKPEGPWFEGWYTRIEDREKGLSFAIIATSYQSLGEVRSAKGMRGYIALMIEDRTGSKAQVLESYPSITHLEEGPDDFAWSAPEIAYVSKNSINLNLPVGARVEIRVRSRKPWATEHSSPEGAMSDLPIPLHWHVHNAGGLADYNLEYSQGGQKKTVAGTGIIHQEKNWGVLFPKSWIWMQAFEGDSALAVAGGEIDLGPLPARSYMIKYRTAKHSIEFNLGETYRTAFRVRSDACQGVLLMEAVKGEYRLNVRAEADPQSFFDLAIFSREGYQPKGAIESFRSKITVTVYKNVGRFGQLRYEILDSETFHNAALEFGADAKRCGTQTSG